MWYNYTCVAYSLGELSELICLYFAIFVWQKEEQQLGSETGSSSEDQLSETELGIEELQLLLQAMQFRRFVKKTLFHYYHFFFSRL